MIIPIISYVKTAHKPLSRVSEGDGRDFGDARYHNKIPLNIKRVRKIFNFLYSTESNIEISNQFVINFFSNGWDNVNAADNAFIINNKPNLKIKERANISYQIIAYKFPYMNISLYDSFISVEKLYHFYYVYLSLYKHAFKSIKQKATSDKDEKYVIKETDVFSFLQPMDAEEGATDMLRNVILSLDITGVLLDKYEVITRPL